MNYTIASKSNFLDNFLVPISKINTKSILKVNETSITSLIAASDGTLILYATFQNTIESEPFKQVLNLASSDKFIKLLKHVPSDTVVLKLEDNNIKYSSPQMRFTYYLLDDGILSVPSIDVEKIKNLKHDVVFELTSERLAELIKLSSYSTEDINKVYIYTDEQGVYAELTDKKRPNVDSATVFLSNSFEGAQISKPLPVNLEAIRLISSNKSSSNKVYVNNNLNVFVIESNTENTKLTYIVAGLQS